MAEPESGNSTPSTAELQAQSRRQKWILAAIILAVILVIALIALAVFALLQPESPTSTIRDIFIIFMAFESLIIGAALVVLIVQFASLLNLLQNEVRPILQATNDTVNNLRGTTEFLSENLVEPVMKLNSSLAGLRKFFDLLGINRK
jgi:amino acid permease